MRAASLGRETGRAHRRAPARCRRSRRSPATKRAMSRVSGSLRQGAGRSSPEYKAPARPGAASGGRSGRTGDRPPPGPRHRPRKKAARECSTAAMETWNSPRDGGQGRQVQVDGDGGEDGQQPEQGDQLEAPERREVSAAGDRKRTWRHADRGMGRRSARRILGKAGRNALCIDAQLAVGRSLTLPPP